MATIPLVIRFPAKPPAVMRGTGFRKQDRRAVTGSLPGAGFRLHRIFASRFACQLIPLGANAWRRPFARLQRLPVSRSPLQGHRSRSADSALHSPFPRLVRLTAPPPLAVCFRLSRLHRRGPSPRSGSSASNRASVSTPLQGLSFPSGSKRSTDLPFESSPSGNTR